MLLLASGFGRGWAVLVGTLYPPLSAFLGHPGGANWSCYFFTSLAGVSSPLGAINFNYNNSKYA